MMPVAVAVPAVPTAAAPSKQGKPDDTFGKTLAVHVAKRGDNLHDDGGARTASADTTSAHTANAEAAGARADGARAGSSVGAGSGVPSEVPALDVPAGEASGPGGYVHPDGTAQASEILQPGQPAIALPIPDARHHLPGLPSTPAAPSDALGDAPTAAHAEVLDGEADLLADAAEVAGGVPVPAEGQQAQQQAQAQAPSPGANATGGTAVQEQKPVPQGGLPAPLAPSTGPTAAPAPKTAAPAAGPGTIEVPGSAARVAGPGPNPVLSSDLAAPAPVSARVDGQSELSVPSTADTPDTPIAVGSPAPRPGTGAHTPPTDAVRPVEAQALPVTNVPRVQPDVAAAAVATEASRPGQVPSSSSYPSLAGQIFKPAFSLTGAAPGEYAITVQVAPENLGPVTVKALVTQDGLRVELFAPNDAGREALKAVLPELRRECSSSTMQATVDVSSENADTGGTADRGRERRDFELLHRQAAAGVAEEPLPDRAVPIWHSTSTIDLLA